MGAGVGPGHAPPRLSSHRKRVSFFAVYLVSRLFACSRFGLVISPSEVAATVVPAGVPE